MLCCCSFVDAGRSQGQTFDTVLPRVSRVPHLLQVDQDVDAAQAHGAPLAACVRVRQHERVRQGVRLARSLPRPCQAACAEADRVRPMSNQVHRQAHATLSLEDSSLQAARGRKRWRRQWQWQHECQQ